MPFWARGLRVGKLPQTSRIPTSVDRNRFSVVESMASPKMPDIFAGDEDRQWLEHFGLRRRPFVAVPSPEHYFPAEPIESARQNLLRMVRRAEGAGLIAGPPGTGKSLLCHLLARELAHQFAVVLLPSGRIDSSRILWQAILFRLGLSFHGLNEGELQIALESYLRAEELPPFLTRTSRAILPPRPVVLLVDEAHSLPLKILEDIRGLTNIVGGDTPRAHVILCGNMLLEDRLNSPRLEAFSQRIVVRAYLQPFIKPQTEGFVRHQIALAGGDPDRIFSADALEAVHRASSGIPRLVNQICDHSLFLAFAYGRGRIDWQLVEEAWADLQQLPGPWNDSLARTTRPSIIEFGTLSEGTPSSRNTGQMPSTVPFLRVACEESPEESSALEALEHVEKVVESLVAEEGCVSGKFSVQEEIAVCAPASSINSSEPRGLGSDPGGLSGQGNLPPVEAPVGAIHIEPPPVVDPFAEVFDSESSVSTSHVEYISRQSHRFRTQRADIWLYGRNNRRFASMGTLGGMWPQGEAEAFEFPPAYLGAGVYPGWAWSAPSGMEAGEQLSSFKEGQKLSAFAVGVGIGTGSEQLTAVTWGTELPRSAECSFGLQLEWFFSQEPVRQMGPEKARMRQVEQSPTVFSTDTLSCGAMHECNEGKNPKSRICLQFPWCGVKEPAAGTEQAQAEGENFLRPVRRTP